MDFIDQIEDLRARLNAEVRSTHDQLGGLNAEMRANDSSLMDHISKIIDDHGMRRRDIAAKLASLIAPPSVPGLADSMSIPSFMQQQNGRSLQ